MQIWGVPERIWYSCTSCDIARNRWAHASHSDTGTQSLCELDWLQNTICNSAMLIVMTWAHNPPVNLNLWYMPAIASGLPQFRKQSLIFRHKYSMLLRQSPRQVRLGKKWCRICHNATQTICRWFSWALDLWLYGSNRCGFAWNQRATCSYLDTAIWYRHDAIYCYIGLPNLQCTMYLNITSWHMAKTLRCARKLLQCVLFTLLTSQCILGHKVSAQYKITTNEWFEVSSLHYSQSSTLAVHPHLGQP